MDTLRSVSHLQRELGDNLFDALVSSDNTEAVREFAARLAEAPMPTEMTLGDRTYEILGFLKEEDGMSVVGHTMVERAKEMNANLGKDDGQYLLDHQEEIPEVLRGKVVFVFPDWRVPGLPGRVACVNWHGRRWVRPWRWLDGGFSGYSRLLRRK